MKLDTINCSMFDKSMMPAWNLLMVKALSARQLRRILAPADLFLEDYTKLPSKEKKYVAKLWDGTQIFLVDGAKVRDEYNVAFVGGTHPKHEDCKTYKEIWIEKGKSGPEESKILVHEIIEYILMRYASMNYNKAHDIANSVERAVRLMSRF